MATLIRVKSSFLVSGLGPNTHFGIKYKYNSAKSNTNTLLFHVSIQMQIRFPIQIQFFDLNAIQITNTCTLRCDYTLEGTCLLLC